MTFQNITEQELNELIELQRKSKNEPMQRGENRAGLQKLQEEANPLLIEQLRGVKEDITEAVEKTTKKLSDIEEYNIEKEKEMRKMYQQKQQEERKIFKGKPSERSELFAEVKQYGWSKKWNESSVKDMRHFLQDAKEQQIEKLKREELKELSTEAGNDPPPKKIRIYEEEEESEESPSEFEEEVKRGKGLESENMEKVPKEFIKILEGGVENNKQLKRLLVLSNKLIKYKHMTKQEFEELVSG